MRMGMDRTIDFGSPLVSSECYGLRSAVDELFKEEKEFTFKNLSGFDLTIELIKIHNASASEASFERRVSALVSEYFTSGKLVSHNDQSIVCRSITQRLTTAMLENHHISCPNADKEDMYVNLDISQIELMHIQNYMSKSKLSKYIGAIITVPGKVTPKYWQPTTYRMLRTTYEEYQECLESNEIREIMKTRSKSIKFQDGGDLSQ